MPDLKPCPFCGFSMVLVYNDNRVVCGNCSVEIKRSTKEKAIEAWNRRAGIAKEVILDAPTVDAVPVVRCRECVGRSFWEKDHNGVPVCLLSGLYARNENDFCPYGERKDGDE